MSTGHSDERLRALIVQHEQPTPGGYVHQWLDERGAEQDIYRIDVEDREVDARDYGIIVSLGSEFAAFDDSIPWLEKEKNLFRAATDEDVPVLGICFGGQLLARVLGGESFRGEIAEIGWLPVRSHDHSMVPGGPWFQWHFDTFTAPLGSSLIADSPAGPQAYRIGRSMGVQFHPEVTPEIMDSWVAVYRHELDQEGVDPDRLLEETHRRADETRAAAWRLFDSFLAQARNAEAVRDR
ncbi:MAG TPA: type 1 glutamine amidotransferase [Solirubrobacteraceae bacterium]|nr:type 1 glutamine amidotransferase [Solirubrobacteraceae bacterium]